MTCLHFAQISDIHISTQGDQYDMLSGRSAGFLANVIAHLNDHSDLDFVLFGGDLMVDATQQEFEVVQQVIQKLKKPYYLIPGNHDRSNPGQPQGLSRQQFARYFNPQFAARPTAPEAQVGYWSVALSPEVQLIGLDSVRDQDWGGFIDPIQLEWLADELAACTDKLVILAVHHPLHPLSPVDNHPVWHKFVCENGSEVMALLDRHPQVKLVLTAHHHLTRMDLFGSRLHLACPALAIYPCAYRTIRLCAQTDHTWTIEWQTHAATEPGTIAEARTLMLQQWMQVGFDPHFVEEMARLALGSVQDRQGQITV